MEFHSKKIAVRAEKMGFQLASRAANSCDAMDGHRCSHLTAASQGNINTSESLAKFGAVKKKQIEHTATCGLPGLGNPFFHQSYLAITGCQGWYYAPPQMSPPSEVAIPVQF